MSRRFRDDVPCSRCSHPYRLHTAASDKGGEDDACTACFSCWHFLPAYPQRRVVKATIAYAEKRTGSKRKTVHMKIGWRLELDCGHGGISPRRLASFGCRVCPQKEAS